MANTASVVSSFKSEVMLGAHQLGAVTIVSRGSLTAPATDAVKASLYLTTGTVGAASTVYTASGEVTGANYSAGGVVVTNATAPTTAGTVGYWTPSASIVYTGVTLATAFDGVMLYNSTQANRAIETFNIGSQTVTAGTLTLTMPVNDGTTGLLRLA